PETIEALAETGHAEAALALYREASAKGLAQPRDAGRLLAHLVRANSPESAKVFLEIAAAYRFENLAPGEAWTMLGTARTAQPAAPAAAAEVYEQVLKAVSAGNYGVDDQDRLEGEFQLGPKTVHTSSSRDTLLLVA